MHIPVSRFRLAIAAGLVSAALAWAPPAPAAEPPADAAGSWLTTAPDSARVELPVLTVTGQAAPPPKAGTTRIPTEELEIRAPGSLADLGALLPAARVATNSRGESTLMIRGAPERHVQTFLDGIPLNLPWDERVDLSTVPITGGAGLEGRRGLPSLLAGPGALAGSVHVLPPQLHGADRATRARAGFGPEGAWNAGLSHQRHAGQWDLLGAGDWRTRDGWLVPDGTPAGVAPSPDPDVRFNSDLEQGSLLLRASRPVAETGRLNLLATGWSVEKGVPPELHLGEDARFWRYPERRRMLLGASIARPLDASRAWELTSMAAFDVLRQEIDPRGPDRWDQPLVAGEDYETDLDRTGHLELGLNRHYEGGARLSLQGNARYAHHRESLVVDGPEESYAQWLAGLVAEIDVYLFERWDLRAGAGWDGSSTPESGDKERADSFDAPALAVRLAHDLGPRADAYASVSRRSRFPSLRELYSGALGKFVPNPDLVPEKQTLVEFGVDAEGTTWRASGSAFLQQLDDGIEKQKLPDGSGRFQRVNLTAIRIPGIELSGSWRLRPELVLGAHHTILSARVKQDGEYDQPAEDRPDYLSRVEIGWRPLSGPGLDLEAVVTGPRWSADATDDIDGLKRLPAGVNWNVRAGWTLQTFQESGSVRRTDLFVRVANLFDQRVDWQVGLPGPGRTVSAGISSEF